MSRSVASETCNKSVRLVTKELIQTHVDLDLSLRFHVYVFACLVLTKTIFFDLGKFLSVFMCFSLGYCYAPKDFAPKKMTFSLSKKRISSNMLDFVIFASSI